MVMKRISLTVLIGFSALLCMGNNESDDLLKLWYEKPAKTWNEALPIGNGRLGAMVFGDPATEHLQLNESTFWAGAPYNNVNEQSATWIPLVRKLIFEGKYKEAQELADKNIYSVQNGMPYQPVGDIFISFPGHNVVSGYYRELDIHNAIASVKYEVDGVHYVREYFSSFTDNVIIIRMTADRPGMISCDVRITSGLKHVIGIKDDNLVMSGLSDDHEEIRGVVRYSSRLSALPQGGKLIANDSILGIRNADILTLYVSIATNFINYHDISGNQEAKSEFFLTNALKKDYFTARDDHTSFYRNYFDRVRLNLGITDSANNPTNTRIRQFGQGNDPQLVTLYFQYGRYLLISSSEPGTQAANLQGIWNSKIKPPWDCKYTININTEMNYWPAEVTNLTELNDPLFSMIKDLSETGREAAKKLYKARGWVAHHNTDIWRITGVVDKAFYGLWPMGGVWLTQHIWQHYLFTGDTAFLKAYYPAMRSSAEFCLDVMQKEPEHGWLVICPSISPENSYSDGVSVTAGTTMDNQLLFDLFSNIIQASEILNTDSEFADSAENVLSHLAPMQIGQYSQLQEWMQDWDRTDDRHRHISHLYGLYPSNQISPDRTPELFEAAQNSLKYRGDASTGWSMGWKVCLWARLLNGNHAYKLLTDQLNIVYGDRGHGGTYPNMLDAHPPFQIDGNFGCTAGIAEMLMQSQDGFIRILPALPDIWPDGRVEGLAARGGFEISIEWSEGNVKKLKVYSKLGGNCRLKIPNPVKADNNLILSPPGGNNPNPFYYVPEVKRPLTSDKAELHGITADKDFTYDVSTVAGETLYFTGIN